MDFYPRRGFGQISEALADAATTAGAKIRFGCAVTGLRARDGAWTVETENGAVDVSTVWSTAPLPALVALLDPAPPSEVLKSAGRLEHRAMVLAYLVLDQPGWTEFDAHYFPAADVAASRVSEPRRFRSSDDDPPDRTVLCAELPCAVGDETWTATAEQLGAGVAADLARQGLPIVQPVATEVRRVPRVYPVYRRGFAWDQSAVELWCAATHPGLIGLGRGATFTADNTHHSLAMGWAAAASLDGSGAIDPARWARARAAARRFVVED